MKKLSVLMVMLLILSGITFAQERGGGERPSRSGEAARPGGGRGDRPQMTPEQMLQRQTQRLVEELKLTKEQETKVTAINKKYAQNQSVDWSKMRDASDEERTKMRADMAKVQAEKDKEIKAILKPDQVKLYDEMLKRRMENRRGGPGGQRP